MPMPMTPERFQDRWEHFRGEPQQVSGVWMLYEAIRKIDTAGGVLDEYAPWSLKFSEKPPTSPAPAKLTPSAPFSAYVTPHVQYGEICLWDEKRRFKSQASCDTAIRLCEFVEKCRAHFGVPILITSGHRPEPINSQVGGAPNSEHTFYAAGVGALDIALERGDQYALQNYCDKNWPYSVGYGAPSFVHIGLRGDNLKRRWDY